MCASASCDTNLWVRSVYIPLNTRLPQTCFVSLSLETCCWDRLDTKLGALEEDLELNLTEVNRIYPSVVGSMEVINLQVNKIMKGETVSVPEEKINWLYTQNLYYTNTGLTFQWHLFHKQLQALLDNPSLHPSSVLLPTCQYGTLRHLWFTSLKLIIKRTLVAVRLEHVQEKLLLCKKKDQLIICPQLMHFTNVQINVMVELIP